MVKTSLYPSKRKTKLQWYLNNYIVMSIEPNEKAIPKYKKLSPFLRNIYIKKLPMQYKNS
jgi:hypothetical protein